MISLDKYISDLTHSINKYDKESVSADEILELAEIIRDELALLKEVEK